MAKHEAELKRRLGRVRRRWRLTAGLRGLLLVATEALGIFLVVVLADLIYKFSGAVLLGLWCAGGAVLAVLFARHVLYPLLRGISDDQTALLIEERAEQAEGAVISAVEFSHQKRRGLYNFIVDFLVDDAVARIDRTPLRVVSNVRRLRKHLLVALALLAVSMGTTLSFPHLRGASHTVLNPLVRMEQEARKARDLEEARLAYELQKYGPIDFEVRPGDVSVLRGSSVPVLVKLSRTPAELPRLLCRTKGAGDWEPLTMDEAQGRNSFARRLIDVNEDKEYLVAAANQQSKVFTVSVFDPLSIRGLRLTYHYPSYLEREPETKLGPSGDITTLAGTKMDLSVVANNPLASGQIVFEEEGRKKTLPLKPDAKARQEAQMSFTVTKDATYTVAVTDVHGDTVRSDQFFFVKAVADEPPTVEMVCPKVDMSIHPLCEVTFKAKVTDDFGVKGGAVKAQLYRGEDVRPLSFEMKTSDDAGRTTNVRDGTAEYVMELDGTKPAMQPGDMIFYHYEISDRKGQSVKTDVFYIKMWPLEVAATWPDSIAPPDLPHETFNDPMDLMLFLAAAWNLEQQRGQIPTGEFNAKSEKIAERMEVGSPPDFSAFWGHGGAPAGGGPNRGQILAAATTRIETAHGLLKRDHQPGKAADHMRVALAMVETLGSDKRLLALELNPEPIHTGQPSSGHADDPVMEQIAFRIPSVMNDSITAFQQPDNPPRLLPPDYRRALRIKQRKAFRTKQLRVAGEIYATEEQLIEMAREQLGHIQLREAIDDNTPNDPAQSSGTGGEEIRVDKRAIPYKELVTATDRRGDVPRAEKQTLSEPKVDQIKSPLKYDRIPNNRRRGGPNPYTTQAPGGGSQPDEEDEQPPERMDEDDLRRMRQRIMSRRQPQSSSSGGGGEPMPEGMPMPGGMGQQQPQPGGGMPAMQQMASWQQSLARATGDLARDVARSMEPADAMSTQAVDQLRAAAGQMQQASRSFARGDVRSGIQQARRAREMVRQAMHRMKVSQYDSLEQAVAAAQDGAMALVANQYRISRSTEQVARRVGELSGQPSQPQPGQGQPGQAQPGQAQPGQAQPGQAQPGQAQPGQAQPGQAQPGQAQPGQAQPGQAQPGQAQPGQAQPGQAQPGQAQPGQAQPGAGVPSRQAVRQAVKLDPQIGPRLKGLAAEQGRMAQDLGAFMEYVKDLRKWAGEATKDRVAGSLGAVNVNLQRGGTPQKMVDAAVGLAGMDLPAARAAQQDIDKALREMVGGVQEAGEILAGSTTGILRRAAREAKEVGEQVASLSGGGSSGGQGRPGKGRPPTGQAQASQGEPGKAQPGQAQPGTGEPGKGEPGKGEPGKAEPGKGEPGKAEPGTDLAKHLAGEPEPGQRRSGSPSGGGPGANEDIDLLWLKSHRLVGLLEREQLAEQQAIRFMKRRTADISSFREMFQRSQQAEAVKFSQVALGVGKNLEQALQEALSAKRLHDEQREECPPKYRQFVNAYFEALSKAASGTN